jgi:hypothetical protein
MIPKSNLQERPLCKVAKSGKHDEHACGLLKVEVVE